jgi:hypothetical protein
MTKIEEVQIAAASSLASSENEGGGAVFPSEVFPATSWFVPPLLVPIFLFVLLLAHLAYQWGVS